MCLYPLATIKTQRSTKCHLGYLERAEQTNWILVLHIIFLTIARKVCLHSLDYEEEFEIHMHVYCS